MANEEMIKAVVDILSADSDDDGYDWDTVDAKKAVIAFFDLAEGNPEEIADFIDDIPLNKLGV